MIQQGIISKGNLFRAERYLYMAYGVGYNAGNVVKHKELPVERINDLGKRIGREYDSATMASRLTGVCESSITKVCRGHRNKAGGTGWRYVKPITQENESAY